MTPAAPSCRLDAATAAGLRRTFTRLHEGAPPDAILCEAPPRAPRRLRPLVPGAAETRLSAVQYRKRVTNGAFPYMHPIAPHARPRLFVDERGHLHAEAGSLVVTTHGIEDRAARDVRPEGVPVVAQTFVDLGPLEWLRYEWLENGRELSGTLAFGAHDAPVVAHDERGHLRFLGPHDARSRISMSEYGVARANPGDWMEDAIRTLQSGVIIGGIAAATDMGLDYAIGKASDALARRAAAGAMFAGGIGEYQRAGIKAATGLALSYGVGMIDAPGAATVSMGIGVGAMSGAIRDTVREFLRRRAQAAAAGAGVGTNPGMGALPAPSNVHAFTGHQQFAPVPRAA